MVKVRKNFIQKHFNATLTGEPIMQSVKPAVLPVEPELFRDMVAARAFYRAEQRGFEPGHELEDWLEAEQEFLRDPSLLTGGTSQSSTLDRHTKDR